MPWLRREAVESEIPRVKRFHEARREALRGLAREALAPAYPDGVPEDLEALACVLLDHPSAVVDRMITCDQMLDRMCRHSIGTGPQPITNGTSSPT